MGLALDVLRQVDLSGVGFFTIGKETSKLLGFHVHLRMGFQLARLSELHAALITQIGLLIEVLSEMAIQRIVGAC